jgi:hypothetical protein
MQKIKGINHLSNQRAKKQQGVVLVVALVFLVALTAVASMLMLNTTTDMKMAGATQEKMIAHNEAIGSVDELIFKQLTENNNFTRSSYPDDIAVVVTAQNTAAFISMPKNRSTNEELTSTETDCPASRVPSSIFKCNVLAIRVEKKYGRENTSRVVVRAGIAQQLLNLGGSS